jgi:serine/threonine protein kinase
MDETTAPLVPGYTTGRLLGCGGSATVWLGTDHQTGREFALKCFRPARGSRRGSGGRSEEAGQGDAAQENAAQKDAVQEDNAAQEAAVQREIRILSVLDHQHLTTAHHAVRFDSSSGGGTALVLDYAPGGSLAQLVAARGRLGVGETVTVVTPIAQALSYLHGKGFTHSDVSPGNVLFTSQGKPLLSDVGIARILGDPGHGQAFGTPGFLDPAPVDAVRAGLQPERDVYSLAAVGWYCLTGAAPPATDERPPLSLLVPDVPEELAAVLEAGLNEDRRLRPTAAALAAAVYRSAPPRPVDLAASVHPTVLPELVTRRHVPPSSGWHRIIRPSRLKEKLDGWNRRKLAARWVKGRSAGPRLPFPATTTAPAVHDKHAVHGKHAAPRGMPGRRLRRLVMPAAGAAALAVAWWMAAAPAGPLTPEPGSTAGAPAETVAGAGKAAAGADAVREARQHAAAPDPAVAVAGLAALRDHAFASGRLELLDEVNAKGSPAAAADARTAGRLRGPGHVLAGFASLLSDVVTEGASGGRAVVGATSATSAYEEKDRAGTVLASGAASAGQRLRLVLVSVDGRWRISEILPGS